MVRPNTQAGLLGDGAVDPGAQRPLPLPRRIRELLRRGDLESRYPSRSEPALAIAMSCVIHGWDLAAYWAAANDPRNEGLHPWAWFRANGTRRSPGDARRRVTNTWEKAKKRVAADPPIRDRAAVLAYLSEVLSAIADPGQWRGVAGATDRAVLLAVLRIALEAHTLRPNLSCRRVAEMAGVGRTTVGRSLKRLQDQGWLHRVLRHTPALAATFRLSVGGTRSHAGTGEAYVSHIPSSSSDGADAFRWRHGLGKVAARYYDILCDRPVLLEDLASVFGVRPWTTRTHLQHLRSFGLAEVTDRGWVRGPILLEQAAHDMGAAGSSRNQRRQHQRERAAYAAFRTHVAQYMAESAGVLVHLEPFEPEPPVAPHSEAADAS